MPLVSIVNEIRKAQAGGYCLPLFLTYDMASTEGIFQALEEKQSPAMVGVYSTWFDLPGATAVTTMVRTMAGAGRAPISLMLDHGDTIEQCVKALARGFTDVMYDGSKLPLEENIANTKFIVRAAHAVGAGVEAELGHVGQGAEYDTYGGAGKGFTDPAVAERFVAETGVDILAVAIGNAHGVYRGEPRLNVDLLREIRRRVPVPLSLHGGTGLSDEQFRAAIGGGVAKVNIFTDLSLAAAAGVADLCKAGPPSYFDVVGAIREAFRQRCCRYVEVFGSAGRARTIRCQ